MAGPSTLPPPHGGALCERLAPPDRARALRDEAEGLPAWTLTPRQRCDLELILTGGFSPLQGFLGRADYEAVCDRMRLAGGALWPIPVTLDLPEGVAGGLRPGGRLALRDADGTLLAVLTVSDAWRPDREAEAVAVFGTVDRGHPGVRFLLESSHPWYVGGTVEGIAAPAHSDFPELRLTPRALREVFAADGWTRVVAFQTRNPLHRAHVELTMRAARDSGAKLLVHPVVGMTKPGDVDHVTRVRCYQAVIPRYPPGTARLALLPLAMRMGGPREAVWHAIIRKNYGCTHFIVGRDHAGPGRDAAGKPYYGPYDAQELLRRHEAELGIAMVPFKMMVYVEAERRYVPEDEVPPGAKVLSISGTELRQRLKDGAEIPEWFSYPEVAEILRANPNPL
jgi:sulfate adenylyltransferase